MKRIILLCLILLPAVTLTAQFKNFTIKKCDVPQLEIVQIDFCEKSTFVHMKFTNDSSAWICAGSNFYIKDNLTNRKFKLLNSINLPICDKVHVFDNHGQVHNFTLEFEKIPDPSRNIDIIETLDGGLNVYGIEIDKEIRENNFLNINEFIAETPVKEYSVYYKEGNPILNYVHNGIRIASGLTTSSDYGKYYQTFILIQNFSGKDITFDPSLIKATNKSKKKVNDLNVLTYQEYMTKVENRQAWTAAIVAFNEGVAASNAGYSTSSTQSSAYATTSSYGSASGYFGNDYVNMYGSGTSSSVAYGSSTTNSYNGAAAYSAQQNANNNVSNFQNQQSQIQNTLSSGYMKINTINDQAGYFGYVNIAYKKGEEMQIEIPINGSTYKFTWKN